MYHREDRRYNAGVAPLMRLKLSSGIPMERRIPDAGSLCRLSMYIRYIANQPGALCSCAAPASANNSTRLLQMAPRPWGCKTSYLNPMQRQAQCCTPKPPALKCTVRLWCDVRSHRGGFSPHTTLLRAHGCLWKATRVMRALGTQAAQLKRSYSWSPPAAQDLRERENCAPGADFFTVTIRGEAEGRLQGTWHIQSSPNSEFGVNYCASQSSGSSSKSRAR